MLAKCPFGEKLVTVVFNIGYEGTDVERFIETLKVVGIEYLADVRAIPHSRKKGFSKRGLAERLSQAGIRYEHFVELGDPKNGREAARSGDYPKFRRIYEKHIDSAVARAALERLTEVASAAITCMLCFERDPRTCHRSIIAERLGAIGHDSFELYGDDPERYRRHRSKLPRSRIGKGAAPPEHETR